MGIAVIIGLALVIAPGSTRASTLVSTLAASAHVECLGGTHVVTVGGSYYEGIAGEFDHLVLKRQAIGTCEPDAFLLDALLPFEPVDEDGYFRFRATVAVVPPRDNVVYRYVPYAVRPDGSLLAISSHCDADGRSYALTDCGTAPFLRGRVEIVLYCSGFICFRIVSCAADCWTESASTIFDPATLTALAGESTFALIGQVVDVYGRRTYCGMLGDPPHVITRIELTAEFGRHFEERPDLRRRKNHGFGTSTPPAVAFRHALRVSSSRLSMS